MKGKKKVLTIQARVALLTTKGLAKNEYRSVDDIAGRLGWSEGLVHATINRINEFEAGSGSTCLSYNPQDGGGWKLAATWTDDKEYYVRWLMRHIATRIASVVRHVEVASGLVSDSVPPGLLPVLKALGQTADGIRQLLPDDSARVPQPMKVPQRTTVIK